MKLKYLIAIIICLGSNLVFARNKDIIQFGIRACNAEATYYTLAHYKYFNDIMEAKDFKEENIYKCYKNYNELAEKSEESVVKWMRENYVKFYAKIENLLEQHKNDAKYNKFYKKIVYFHFGV